MIKTLVRGFIPKAHGQNLKLHTEIGGNVPRMVLGGIHLSSFLLASPPPSPQLLHGVPCRSAAFAPSALELDQQRDEGRHFSLLCDAVLLR
jgi:hypothetical protein